jgi:hypothetical protein
MNDPRSREVLRAFPRDIPRTARSRTRANI